MLPGVSFQVVGPEYLTQNGLILIRQKTGLDSGGRKMEGRGNEGNGGPCPQKLSTPQLKFLVAPLLKHAHAWPPILVSIFLGVSLSGNLIYFRTILLKITSLLQLHRGRP